LHCVDPYIHQPDWVDCLNHDARGFQTVKETAKAHLKPWLTNGRCVLHECTSLEASKFWWAKDLAFVYLDARHDYASVMADLNAWYPTIRPGGVLAGHDYLNGTIGEGAQRTVFDVKRAVTQWLGQHGYTDVHVTEYDQYPTWYLIKHDSTDAQNQISADD
jgi:hypothetical protein